MSEHARLSPSNLRWPVCAGSVRGEANYAERPPGAPAIDGTGSHLLLEHCLVEGVDAKRYLHQTLGEGHEDCPSGWRVEYDRVRRVQMAISYVQRRQQESLDLMIQPESKSDPGYWFGRTDWWGTCDIVLEGIGEGVLEVIDYKDGRGWVPPTTPQLVSYMLGKLMPHLHPGSHAPMDVRVITDKELTECKIQRLRLTIIQPRTDPPIRYRDLTLKEFWEEAKNLVSAAFTTDDPDAPLVPGKHCQWCAHKENCSARNEDKAMELTANLAMPDTASLAERLTRDPASISTETLSQFLDSWKALQELHEMAEAEAQRRIEEGQDVPGYMIAPGRATRKWSQSEEEIWVKLRNMGLKKGDAYEIKLKSPAKIAELPQLTDRQKKRVQEFISVIEGKPKLKKGTPKAVKDVTEMFPISFM